MVLLHNIENYIQHSVTNHHGKEHFLKVYLCITKSLCCTGEINTIVNQLPVDLNNWSNEKIRHRLGEEIY